MTKRQESLKQQAAEVEKGRKKTWLREKDVCERFGVSPSTLWRRRRNGDPPRWRRTRPGITSPIVYKITDVEEWAAGMATQGGECRPLSQEDDYEVGEASHGASCRGQSVVRRCPRELGDYGPCPYVGCRHHLYLDVDEQTSSLMYTSPGLEPWELKETCSIDVAMRGGDTLQAIAAMLGVTRERVRQLEESALDRAYRRATQLQRDELGEAVKDIERRHR